MVRHRSKKLPFYRIPGFKLVKTATINNMYKSQGAVKEDAIVLDDEDENSVAMSEGGKVGIVDLSEPELEAQVHSTSDSGQGTTSDRPNQGFSPNPSAAKIPEKHIQQALPLSTQIAQEIDKVKGNPILTQTVSAGHPSASSAIASAKDSQWGSHSGGCGLGTKQTSEARNHSTKQAARNTSFVQGTPRKDASPVSSQASRPNNSKAVPGMTRKPAMKKSDPPPTYDVLKPNRKRPLAEMAVGQLFTPGQVISNSEWENTKRQRLEKRQSRALQDITEPSNFQEMFDVGHSQTVNHGDAALSGEAEYSTVENTIDDTINMPDEEYRAPNHRQADKARKYVHFLDDDLETARMTATGPEKATFEPDSPTASKDLDTTVHPTTGGKGISAATLAAWQAESEKTKDTVDIHYEPVYQYFVSRREGKAGNGDIDEANATRLGPFFRLEEANTVASEEIHHPIEHDGLDGVPSKAWSFLFEQDELGMQTHMAEVVGIRIEAEVQRGMNHDNYHLPVRFLFLGLRCQILASS